MKILKRSLIIVFIVIVFLLIFPTLFLNNSILNNIKEGNKDTYIDLSSSYDIRRDHFNGTGSNLNVSLYGNRSIHQNNINVKEEDLMISNNMLGWNISEFKLNFTAIYAADANVSYEIRNDGSEEITNTDIAYANSFQIPNSCHVRNLSMFIQYPGGYFEYQGFMGNNYSTTKNSEFSIRIYNTTLNDSKIIPDQPIDDFEEDDIYFNLSKYDHAQPARWYQSNFTTNNFLNISNTYNKTWFAVFKPLQIPSGGRFPTMNPYYYYAEEQLGDKYKINLFKNTSSWQEQTGKNGMFKIKFSPVNKTPSPDQVNLSVFNTQVTNDGLYFNNSFFPHINNKFHLAINSPWFGNVTVNVTFEGIFRYDTKSNNYFTVVNGSDVLWNSTLKIDEYNGEFYNRSAKFYKPEYWTHLNTHNNTQLFKNINNQSKFIELNDVSNDTWIISYSQANTIINPKYIYSTDKIEWYNFEEKEFINSTNYVNITSIFNNSNGDAFLYVYTGASSQEDFKIHHELTNLSYSFPLWRPRYNLTILKNDTLAKIQIMTNNGTMAGIVSKSFRVLLQKNETTLHLISNLKNSYIYGDQLNLEVSLQSNNEPLFGELVQFKITEVFSRGLINELFRNDTTDDEGIARISYSIREEVKTIRINISYDGNVEYNTAEFSTSSLTIRSPTEQFFLDFFPYLILIIIAVMGFISYFTIMHYRFKKNMKVWERKTQKFADVLKIDLILVIHKESGAALIQKSFSDIPIDGNLISGFLQAVSSFKREIKDDFDKGRKETILLDYQDYNILLKDGEFVRVALILNSKPSENLKESLKEFIIDFEKKAFNHLKQFKGNVAPFKEYFIDLVNSHFKMSFIKPHIINENPPSISLNSFQERILAIAKTLQSDAGQFYISQLLNYLLSAEPNEPKERFIANIYDLKEYGFIETT